MGRDEPGRLGVSGALRRRQGEKEIQISASRDVLFVSEGSRAAAVGDLHAFFSALQMKSLTGSEIAQLAQFQC